MTTSAAEKLAVEKKEEKVEKRRALGRGLESLLPGPRVVAPGSAGGPVQGSGDGGEQQVPRFVRNDKGLGCMRELRLRRRWRQVGQECPTHTSRCCHAVRDEVISIQAVAETRIPGNLVANLRSGVDREESLPDAVCV